MSPTMRVQAALQRLQEMGSVNATTAILSDRALTRAAHLERDDSQVAVGPAHVSGSLPAVPLRGMPFAAKNLFDVNGCITRAGSDSTSEDPPAREDAFAIAALERAGGVLVALTNMDELAYGFTGENGPDGDTLNPLDPTRIAGGSSAGSGAVVAAGAVPLALGSDTNGSIRLPAALCGVFGLKPTFGRLSRRGCHPFVSSLDHVGPLAVSVDILACAYDALQGHDPLDLAQVRRDPEWVCHAPPEPGLRVAVLGGYFQRSLDDEAALAVQEAARILGARDVVQLRSADAGRAAAFIITATEAGHLHGPAIRRVPQHFGPLVRDRLRAATLIPSDWYVEALHMRQRLTHELDTLLEHHDLLIAPATPCVAPRLDETVMNLGGTDLPMRIAIGMYTHPLTPTGVPVGVAPRITAGGLSVGVQVLAARWREARVIQALAALEAAGFCNRPARWPLKGGGVQA